MKVQTKTGSTFGATLFIMGTCVGIGIISIPISTGVAGFIPAIGMNLLIGLAMLATGLLYAEVILALPPGTNLLSAVGNTIGPFIRVIVGIFLIYVYLSLFTVYFYEAGGIIVVFLKELFNVSIPRYFPIIAIAVFFGFFVFMGLWVANRLNFLLLSGLIISYLLVIIPGAKQMNAQFLVSHNWILIVFAAPLIFVTYAYGIIIPPLVTYVGRNARKIFIAIVIGVSIPLILTSAWQALIMGSVSEETLWRMYEARIPIRESFSLIQSRPWLQKGADFFALFSIVTSLLGSSLGIVDFFLDGFAVPLRERAGKKRLFAILLAYTPPTIFALINPQIFITSLQYFSGFVEAFLNGILPIWMTWVVRYRQKIISPRLCPGGKPALFLLFFFILFVIYLEGLVSLKT